MARIGSYGAGAGGRGDVRRPGEARGPLVFGGRLGACRGLDVPLVLGTAGSADAPSGAVAGRPGNCPAGCARHPYSGLLRPYKKLRLTTPTVILAGERDFMLPPSVITDAGRHADDLRVEVIPGCGHYLHEERPELVAEAAEALFAGRP
ncbi:alpha/beta hydrolase [Streptomyces sp. NPDC002589]|uniref:alpha/beta fold hydrolase n=1 Tax=Streptomyces sp. NPDC002589 TaxID=3154420 RepID=UPI00332E3F96